MENRLEKFAATWKMETTISESTSEQCYSTDAVENLKAVTSNFMHYMSLQDGGVEWLEERLISAKKLAQSS